MTSALARAYSVPLSAPADPDVLEPQTIDLPEGLYDVSANARCHLAHGGGSVTETDVMVLPDSAPRQLPLGGVLSVASAAAEGTCWFVPIATVGDAEPYAPMSDAMPEDPSAPPVSANRRAPSGLPLSLRAMEAIL